MTFSSLDLVTQTDSSDTDVVFTCLYTIHYTVHVLYMYVCAAEHAGDAQHYVAVATQLQLQCNTVE